MSKFSALIKRNAKAQPGRSQQPNQKLIDYATNTGVGNNKFIFRANPACCGSCSQLDGKEVYTKPHPNCKCTLVKDFGKGKSENLLSKIGSGIASFFARKK